LLAVSGNRNTVDVSIVDSVASKRMVAPSVRWVTAVSYLLRSGHGIRRRHRYRVRHGWHSTARVPWRGAGPWWAEAATRPTFLRPWRSDNTRSSDSMRTVMVFTDNV